MANDYQLPEFFSRMGYEIETTVGVDSATGRIRWPGKVMSIPTLTEDFGQEPIQGLGDGPDPALIGSAFEEYELEVESRLAEALANVLFNDFMHLIFGRMVRTITHDAVVGGPFVAGETFTSGPKQGRIITVGAGSLDYMLLTLSNPFSNSDALLGITSGATANATADPIPEGGYILRRPLDTIVTELGWSDADPDVSGPPNAYQLVTNNKVAEVGFAFRPREWIMMRTRMIGLENAPSEAQVTNAPGDNLSDLVAHSTSGAKWKHATFIFREVPSGTPIPVKVRSFDLAISNDPDRIHSDSGTLTAEDIAEGTRRVSFDLTHARLNTVDANTLLNIFRGDPETSAGQIDVEIVIDQPGGFYLSIRLPKCGVNNRSKTTERIVEEGFSGLQFVPSASDLMVVRRAP